MAKGSRKGRGVAVLADGAQAAFAAGAVAELARAERNWTVACGAGLGAQLAVLAVLGEAAEGERRWRRQGETGCPALGTALAAARQRLGADAGVTVAPDAFTLGGWLHDGALHDLLAPELAGVPQRLRVAGARCAVAVEDLTAGRVDWVELAGARPETAAEAMLATARFPAGWGGAFAGETNGGARLLWGGAALVTGGREWLVEGIEWDVVCGFPVPPVERQGLGPSLLETVQRREEVRAGAVIAALAASDSRLHVVAPTSAGYARWAARDGADLGVEYPLPWERNGELVGLLVEYGRAAARESASAAS